MFQNGLLASFIPEFFMVIAYLLCLITPGFEADNSNAEQIPIVVKTSRFESQLTTNFNLSTYNFQQITEPALPKKISFTCFFKKAIPITFVSHFDTSDGLRFVNFSRPPPAFRF